jgi:hypothetical protein
MDLVAARTRGWRSLRRVVQVREKKIVLWGVRASNMHSITSMGSERKAELEARGDCKGRLGFCHLLSVRNGMVTRNDPDWVFTR